VPQIVNTGYTPLAVRDRGQLKEATEDTVEARGAIGTNATPRAVAEERTSIGRTSSVCRAAPEIPTYLDLRRPGECYQPRLMKLGLADTKYCAAVFDILHL
jgi:hypothetical protein